ncbi:MAG: DnaD domain protein [Candidatus Izemoplasmatales bacterium]|jgi:DNA replication protein|nr:DnaD domain protein [Candidatus Izemoplasmatales bacterium]MDY0010439.1 DnaD domain protein [Candidatus Izemoplasmatales bacterium]
MEVMILKKMIAEGIIDFDKLLKKTYKDLGLTEMEAFLLMELNVLKVKEIHFVTPKILTKKLTITEEQAVALMDGLMQKKYLNFILIKGQNGKQKESFDIDLTYRKILEFYQNKILEEMMTSSHKYETLEEEIVELLEKNFQKQIKPLEVEMIIKWVHEYKYTKDDIKDAVFTAIKANRYSISYLDSVLLKKRQINQEVKIKKTGKKKSQVLKEFLES